MSAKCQKRTLGRSIFKLDQLNNSTPFYRAYAVVKTNAASENNALELPRCESLGFRLI